MKGDGPSQPVNEQFGLDVDHNFYEFVSISLPASLDVGLISA
jgi:hypothetical protein